MKIIENIENRLNRKYPNLDGYFEFSHKDNERIIYMIIEF